MMSLGRRGRDFSEEPEMTKQPVWNKKFIDDVTDFHGFITPGGKCSSQRLEDECSTALPSQCTTGSLESLPTTPAGFGTLLPAPVSELVQPYAQPWLPGAQTWHPGSELGELDTLEKFSKELQDALNADLGSELGFFRDATKHFDPSSGLQTGLLEPSVFQVPEEFPGDAEPMLKLLVEQVWQCPAAQTCPGAPDTPHPMPTLINDLDLVSKTLESGDSDNMTKFEPPAVELVSPPSTPRQECTAPRTCPGAPDMYHPMPTLMDALKQNDLDLVLKALESEPECACQPFWDHHAEPPLCAAVRLSCAPSIVDMLLKSGADVKAQNFAGQNPLDVLKATAWHVSTAADIEGLLLSAGAQLSQNSEEKSVTNLIRWDNFADAGTLNDFGLPPGSDFDFDNLFAGVPPPPPPR